MKLRECEFCLTLPSAVNVLAVLIVIVAKSDCIILQVPSQPQPDMRSVDLTSCARFAAPKGNLNTNGIAIGDMDNDGDNEFIMGNIQGDLAVFKYVDSERPRYRSHSLGTITAIAVGKFHPSSPYSSSSAHISMIVINAEGICHAFEILAHQSASPEPGSDQTTFDISPVNSWPVPVNISRAIIFENMLVVGRTDRIIHLYRLVEDENGTRQLTQTAMYAFPGQLGTIVPVQIGEGGGTFAILSLDGTIIEQASLDPCSKGAGGKIDLATEMTIMQSSSDEVVAVLCTMDGQIRFFNLATSQLLSVNVEQQYQQQLFAISTVVKVEKKYQQQQVVVACAWNGDTFFTDSNLNLVRFQFAERVCAFTAGTFAVSPGRSRPCLFYVDFNDSITCFDNVPKISISAIN